MKVDGAAYILPAKIKAELPPGIAGLPAGLPGLAGIALPARTVLEKEREPLHAS
jgi:NADH-quinone oxidoreductase subunit G